MLPCPACGCHARRTDARCPCCGAALPAGRRPPTAAAALLGLAIACSGKEPGTTDTAGDTGVETTTTPTVEPLYGATTTFIPTATGDTGVDVTDSGTGTGGSGS